MREREQSRRSNLMIPVRSIIRYGITHPLLRCNFIVTFTFRYYRQGRHLAHVHATSTKNLWITNISHIRIKFVYFIILHV